MRAAVVPIRSWATGKSRLDLDDTTRTRLARAFALDVLDVLDASPDVDLVVVVTADTDVRHTLEGRRVTVLDDRGLGLDDAVACGRDHALGEGCTALVVVPSDLPCLTVDALSSVIEAARGRRHAFCPDADGDGTTLVVSGDPGSLVTSYGADSAHSHELAGLDRLTDIPEAARRDVDTLDHLRQATHLGVGPHTTAVLSELRGLSEPGP